MLLKIGDVEFNSRLLMGTGKFASTELMRLAIRASETEMATLALKRVDVGRVGIDPVTNGQDDILTSLQDTGVRLLPNTSGATNAKEAIYAAHLAHEAFGTRWVKLEIHPDPRYLMPDPLETLKAAQVLCEQGFTVLPYVHADPVLCKQLEEAGCAVVMPLAAPIGSNQGLQTAAFLRIIIEQANVPVIVDAGLGTPSHAAQAMEMGADAILVNTAISVAHDPVAMAKAFAYAVRAGRLAYQAGMANKTFEAQASSPLTEFLQAQEQAIM
ncbi:thiazole synthase [Saccharobesus litoralis]|uniref:Thiazole synthase n=1 Tax=Saccharobesus litoralis TaxID=2172099 RepID=A0A2S0VNH1_9ALTE|nr:thiazole synthase [Saccharobesus litoralis]AWB65771.1 thiazole synthase [Saccharobesus litoralis]